MGKAKKGKTNTKAAVKAAKKEKQAKKVEQKSKKQLKAEKVAEEEDLLVTLEEFRKLSIPNSPSDSWNKKSFMN